MRRPEEAIVVVVRGGREGDEVLVLERAPARGGYLNLVAGALEPGESPRQAAGRELEEETGLTEVELVDLELDLGYELHDASAEVRARFEPGTSRVRIHAYRVRAPRGWEPVLDEEHVGSRWCSPADAVAILPYPQPRAAVLAASALEGSP